MNHIENPILKGFNPDPSIIRVVDDYYIATSTFEWFPGVQIHHSKDLVNWRLISRPLNRVSQLDMAGNSISGGIFAPCLSYDNGVYYLAYTNVRSFMNGFLDCHNYLVTASDICGEWSEPIYLNSSGFDPSMFHDDDGRKWLVNMVWDYRPDKPNMSGIVLQEFSVEDGCLTGPIHKIYTVSKPEVNGAEGPHIYKRNGWYYLITAEGGTWYDHQVSLARSNDIKGPYEIHPCNPIMTSKDDPDLVLQKAGHADLVETQYGEWYMVFLVGRPLSRRGRCPLGRETAISRVVWKEDGWLYPEDGGNKPSVKVAAPNLPLHPWPKESERDDFDSEKLNINFQSLRVPLGEDQLSLTERPGYLRLKGMESIVSKHRQSLVARRQQAFCYTASTCVEFEPVSFLQMAGLVCLYDTENFFYIFITRDEDIGKCLGIISYDNNKIAFSKRDVCIEGYDKTYLKVDVDHDRLQFFYSSNGCSWKEIGPVFDASRLSDEYCTNGKFTGSFVGLCCQDMLNHTAYADFDYFEYIEK